MKVYLDDVRNPKREYGEDWILVRTYQEAINLLKTGQVEMISLDHDLGYTDPDHTGYDVASWIEQQVDAGKIPCPDVYCHSWNPAGRKQIGQVIDNLNRRYC